MRLIFTITTVALLIALVISASYRNCRVIPGDGLLYHRRIKQDPTKHFCLQFVSYPEVLLDIRHPKDLKVISCILCKDLLENATRSTDSECKILAGGIGHTFVKFAITCGPRKGYDYDVKIYGQEKYNSV